jgi:predicted Mrr-cat superfamily restriction endonuclease
MTLWLIRAGSRGEHEQKFLARDFFRVRLCSRKELLEKLVTHYDQLPEEIRLVLALKRVWMVALQDE